ncbi:MAG: class I SAM-dependent methyltransferase [Patescibacteria group bacterium]
MNNEKLEQKNQESEISLSEEWIALSEAMYDSGFISELSDFFKENNIKTILECGCGGGHILKGLGENGFVGTGIDADEIMIKHAQDKNKNLGFKFLKLNWFDIDKLEGTFDAVMCRGNSLSNFNWGGKINIDYQKVEELIINTLQKMFSKVNPGGLLYVDTESNENILKGNRNIEIKKENLHLRGRVEYDFKNKIRKIFGEGLVNGKRFKGGQNSYLFQPVEIENFLKQLKPEKIWTPKFKHEINYQVFCAKK